MYMFENDDPTPADEGKFLSEAELAAWFQSMQRAYPEVFKADETLYGVFNEQHSFGQKLMTYFDDDPSKPMKCEVLGSRMVKDEQGRGITQSPRYVIRMNGELSQIPWTSAHEEGGWWRGWDVPPPTSSWFS
ncbi:hypothetical protein IV203_005091 [Nitzschia inconspicua]|uniref:Uncharacterized protein n=1 Tax=Nitzschia inconspicua TaxID=303405 RepID=A0A9K3KNA0_9STRA|nr:hypothetical protein IV203_005091 [Nitzschia inconspicua]